MATCTWLAVPAHRGPARRGVVGHHASLTVRRADGTPLPADTPFAACDSGAAVVHVDRLVRTLHASTSSPSASTPAATCKWPCIRATCRRGAINTAWCTRPSSSAAGLGPADIVLDLDAGDPGVNSHGAKALANYRQRGYRLALHGPEQALALPGVLALRPDILRTASADPAVCAAAHAAGRWSKLPESMTEGPSAARRPATATSAWGACSANRDSACRPTPHGHEKPLPSPSSFGAHP